MSDKLKLEFYFVSPLEVVKVTKQNMEEVAEWCGGRVATVESRRNPGRVDSYVWVPTPKGTQISWAFPGMFITKRMVVSEKNELKVTYSVFRRDYFERNYFASPNEAVDKTWERAAVENNKKVKAERGLRVDDKERETPSSPLTEPREAEQHEEAAEREAEAIEKERQELIQAKIDMDLVEEADRSQLANAKKFLESAIGAVEVDDTINSIVEEDTGVKALFVPPLLVEEQKRVTVPNHLK